VVVLDSAPLLATADALLLASLCDVALMVADGRQGRRRAFRRAAESLSQADIPLIGLVLNKAREDGVGYYGHYGYYGGNGHGPDRRAEPGHRNGAGRETAGAGILSRLFRSERLGR